MQSYVQQEGTALRVMEITGIEHAPLAALDLRRTDRQDYSRSGMYEADLS